MSTPDSRPTPDSTAGPDPAAGSTANAGPEPTAGSTASTFEVFTRRNWQSRLEHAGTIHAADPESALLLARETHVRHQEGVEYAVVASEAFHLVADPSTLERKVDMTYRLQAGYSGFREKRERAREAARDRGRGHLADQPAPGRS